VPLALSPSRFLEWVLARLTGSSPRRRVWATTIVAVCFFAIETVDYLTGIRLSLLFFYLVPVTLAVAWLGWGAGLIVALCSLAGRALGDWLAGGREPLEPWVWWNNALAFATFALIVGALNALFRLHRSLEAGIQARTTALEAALAETRRLQRELIEVGAHERAAIGRDLHDDLGQHLFATALASKVLAQRLAEREPAAAAEAQAIVNWIDQAIAKTRDLAHGLLIASIDPLQLPDELADLAAAHNRGAVTCAFRVEGRPHVPDDGTAAQLYRIAQEAVRNAIVHAEPSHVEIRLAEDPFGDVRLEITDDGRGLAAENPRSNGMGLRIMAHRAALIGGNFTIEAASPRGTRIVCRLPRSVASSGHE
jgi:signal transduction histidine kinase